MKIVFAAIFILLAGLAIYFTDTSSSAPDANEQDPLLELLPPTSFEDELVKYESAMYDCVFKPKGDAQRKGFDALLSDLARGGGYQKKSSQYVNDLAIDCARIGIK